MEEQTDSFLLDILRHLVEHLVTAQLVLNQRILLSVCLQTGSLTKLLHIVDVIHPLAVDDLEQDHTLDLTDRLRLRELCLLALIQLHSLFLELLLETVLLRLQHAFRRHRLDRHGGKQERVQLVVIPLFKIGVVTDTDIHAVLRDIRDHLVDRVAHALSIQHASSLLVDDLSLFVHYLIVLQQALTDAEVVVLDLLLCRLDRFGQRFMLDLLSFRDSQRIEHGDHPVRTEETHQIILQGDKELGFTRISLTTGTSTQLIIDTSGLMPLCTDDHQAACRSRLLIQLDIRTTARHVGRNGNGSMYACVRHDLSLELMELGI